MPSSATKMSRQRLVTTRLLFEAVRGIQHVLPSVESMDSLKQQPCGHQAKHEKDIGM